MAKLTEADKQTFAQWMEGVLKENKTTIETEGKKGVTFDTDGYITLLHGKHEVHHTEEGKLTAIEEQKRKQTAKANTTLDDFYRTASDSANGVVGHLGIHHKLSILIREKRDSMHNESGNGDNPPA